MTTEEDKTSKRVRGTKPEVEAAAKRLRHEPTPAEVALWKRLRGRKLDGYKFRRQHPIGACIVDFYCASSKLVVEVDGPIHDDQRERDKSREKLLDEYGYRVMRIRNEEV